jgi:hypothetical protein
MVKESTAFNDDGLTDGVDLGCVYRVGGERSFLGKISFNDKRIRIVCACACVCVLDG